MSQEICQKSCKQLTCIPSTAQLTHTTNFHCCWSLQYFATLLLPDINIWELREATKCLINEGHATLGDGKLNMPFSYSVLLLFIYLLFLGLFLREPNLHGFGASVKFCYLKITITLKFLWYALKIIFIVLAMILLISMFTTFSNTLGLINGQRFIPFLELF